MSDETPEKDHAAAAGEPSTGAEAPLQGSESAATSEAAAEEASGPRSSSPPESEDDRDTPAPASLRGRPPPKPGASNRPPPAAESDGDESEDRATLEVVDGPGLPRSAPGASSEVIAGAAETSPVGVDARAAGEASPSPPSDPGSPGSAPGDGASVRDEAAQASDGEAVSDVQRRSGPPPKPAEVPRPAPSSGSSAVSPSSPPSAASPSSPPGAAPRIPLSPPVPALPPLPEAPPVDTEEEADAGDLGVQPEEKPRPKSLRPMGMISIGQAKPPPPEKRRAIPHEVVDGDDIAVEVDEESPALDVEVEIGEATDVVEIEVDVAEPANLGRSKPPPRRNRDSDAPRRTSEPPPPPGRRVSDPPPARPRTPSAPAIELGGEVEEPSPESLMDTDVAPDSSDDPSEDRVSVEELAPAAVEPPKPPPPPKRRPPPADGSTEPPKVEAKRPRIKPWWEELFTDDFGRGIPALTDQQAKREVSYIEGSLGVAKGGVVLDLACGSGQQAVELASRGYSVVGFDLSLPQLAAAGELAQERSQKLNFLQGDMREMSFEETFDGVYCWNTSFGYFEEERNAAVAQGVFRALRPGGSFLLDVINRDYVVGAQPSSVWFEGDGCVCMDDMAVDFITSRLKVKRTLMLDDGRSKECNYSIRLYSLHELGKLLHDIGFRVVEATGHPAYPGVFFGASSPRVIIVAQKP